MATPVTTQHWHHKRKLSTGFLEIKEDQLQSCLQICFSASLSTDQCWVRHERAVRVPSIRFQSNVSDTLFVDVGAPALLIQGKMGTAATPGPFSFLLRREQYTETVFALCKKGLSVWCLIARMEGLCSSSILVWPWSLTSSRKGSTAYPPFSKRLCESTYTSLDLPMREAFVRERYQKNVFVDFMYLRFPSDMMWYKGDWSSFSILVFCNWRPVRNTCR